MVKLMGRISSAEQIKEMGSKGIWMLQHALFSTVFCITSPFAFIRWSRCGRNWWGWKGELFFQPGLTSSLAEQHHLCDWHFPSWNWQELMMRVDIPQAATIFSSLSTASGCKKSKELFRTWGFVSWKLGSVMQLNNHVGSSWGIFESIVLSRCSV